VRTKKPSAIHELPQEEWDFRRVTRKELSTVVVYEYARSCTWFRDMLLSREKSAHRGSPRKIVKERRASKRVCKEIPDGPMPNQEALHMLRAQLPSQMEIEKTRIREIRKEERVSAFVFLSPHLSTPWLGLRPVLRSIQTVQGRRVFNGGLSEINYGLPIDANNYVGAQRQPYAFIIEWGWSDRELIQKFTRWLDKRRPPEHKGKNRVGKASAAPFHLLRQLAAWRLNQAGHSAETTKDLIADQKRMDATDDHFTVLPTYTRGAWANATKATATLLASEDMFEQLEQQAFAVEFF
jgi:hypothetical protein